jgi:hypothetical protein
VRAPSQPLERQHDVVLEFTECPAHLSTPIKVAVIVCYGRGAPQGGQSVSGFRRISTSSIRPGFARKSRVTR